jgi:ATP-dependent HslUV protease subunit HslV
MAIGSGGDYAEAAARALLTLNDQTAMGVAHRAMRIAADSCVYTNHSFTWQQINGDGTLSQGLADDHSVTPGSEAAADEEPA